MEHNVVFKHVIGLNLVGIRGQRYFMRSYLFVPLHLSCPKCISPCSMQASQEPSSSAAIGGCKVIETFQ
jgi:hypothetical protein